MRYSGVGGQAVMEGVMMKNGTQYAVAVRKPDGEIIVDTKEYKGILSGTGIRKLPFVRGVFNFVESLVLGMRTLAYSASFFEEEEAKTQETQDKKKEAKESMMLGITMACSLAAAIVIFMLIPYLIAGIFRRWIASQAALSLLEGVLRIAVFFAYIVLISRLSDIQRVFMYHGAEHKCINCIEHGLELNVENVRKSSRLHKRCGTSFLFLVAIISMIFFFFIRTDSGVLRIVIRLLLVPLIAGCAYEVIRFAGKNDNVWIDAVSMPGMALQRLTTREPDDAMIEVGIASVEAVFDWKAYITALAKDGGVT